MATLSVALHFPRVFSHFPDGLMGSQMLRCVRFFFVFHCFSTRWEGRGRGGWFESWSCFASPTPAACVCGPLHWCVLPPSGCRASEPSSSRKNRKVALVVRSRSRPTRFSLVGDIVSVAFSICLRLKAFNFCHYLLISPILSICLDRREKKK